MQNFIFYMSIAEFFRTGFISNETDISSSSPVAQCNRIPVQNARKQSHVPLSCCNTHSTPFADFASNSGLETEIAFLLSLSLCCVQHPHHFHFHHFSLYCKLVLLLYIRGHRFHFPWSCSRFLQFGNSLHQRQSGQPVGRIQGPTSELPCCGQLSGGRVCVRGGGPKHHAMTP